MNLLLARMRRDLVASITPKRIIGTIIGAGVAVALLYWILPDYLTLPNGGGKWQTESSYVMQGLIYGCTYGLLAAGLVLIYRTNKIINFAHSQIGAFAAAFFGIETFKWHLPYWVAFIPALMVAAAIGGITEVAVVRRLRKAPAIMSLVATVGAGEFLVLLASAINQSAGTSANYPEPSLLPEFKIGALLVTPAFFAMLVGCPLIVLGIGAFLQFSRTGLAMRAASANSESARMSAIFSSRMSSLAWALAGIMAAYVEIMTEPSLGGSTSVASVAPLLLFISLAAAVMARMKSMPIAFVAGVVIGVSKTLVDINYGNGAQFEWFLFVVVVVVLMLQRQRSGRADPKGSWSAVQAAAPLPLAIRRVRSVRLMAPVALLIFVAVALILPPLIGDSDSVRLAGIFGFMIIGLSIGIITGLGGELSLGQFALSAVGAWVSYEVSMRTGNFFLSFFYAALATAVVGMVISAPAFKAKGLLLTVTTLGFSLVVPDYLLTKKWIFGQNGVNPGAPIIFGHKLDTGESYCYVAIFVLLIALFIARNVRAGGIGRRLIAVRDNEDAARAFTVNSRMVKLQGFALAGFVAGLGGAMYGHSLSTLQATSFIQDSNLTILLQTVIGGLGLLSGPVIGCGLIGGISFFNLGAAGLATTSFGQLVILLYRPQGLGSLFTPLRDALAHFLARRAGVDIEAAYAAERGFSDYASGSGNVPEIAKRRKRARTSSDTLLKVTGLKKSFGGIQAVRGVDFEVKSGETLGLIGPNGAGKTTTFELLAGFTRADAGSVAYAGQNVTALGPEARGQLGLIRSFQDAALFSTLTVLECVLLSLERTEPTKLIPSLLGLRGAEKRKLKQAEELLQWMGLERYRSSQIQELSTGTRRITEIACLVALQPQLLLLDEPSSGVAQRETEALGSLLVRLKAEFDLTLIIIEHDIPLIMGLADRIICMADGEVIAAGTPEMVRNDPAVVEAYLGGSITAIERSVGTGTGAATKPKPVVPQQTPSTESLGDVIPGIGASREAALLGAFGSVEGIRAAGVDELMSVPGIGPGIAARIQNGIAAFELSDRSSR